MVDVNLFNFILYNFLRSSITSLAAFNCWDATTTIAFWKISTQHNIFIENINLDKTETTAHLERLSVTHKTSFGVFLDLNCATSESSLEEVSRRRLFNPSYHWLIYDRGANISNFRRLFSQANLSIDADLTYAMLNAEEETRSNSIFTLFDVYSNGYSHIGGRLNMTADREVICSANGCQVKRFLSSLHLRSKYDHRSQLTDVIIRVATVVTKRPLSLPKDELVKFLSSVNNTGVDMIARFGFQHLMILKDFLNCNMSYHFYDRWSTTDATGGIIGAIFNETADIASSPLLITTARLKQGVALFETGSFREVCMFRTPRNIDIKADLFLKPFNTTTWLIFGSFLIVAAVFLWSTFFIEHHRIEPTTTQALPSMLTSCLIAFGSACIQSSYLIPSSMGGRIAYFSLSLLSFFMYNYYTSIVVSTLLDSPVKTNIQTLGDLADSSLKVGFEPLPFTFVYLNTSQLSDVRRLVKRKIDSVKDAKLIWMPQEVGIRRVRDEPGFVYVLEASPGYALVEKLYNPQQICDLNEIMLRSDTGINTQLKKKSPYLELMRLRDLRMLETGVLLKHRRHWVRTRVNCFTRNYAINVGLEYTAPLFFMIISVYSVVLIVLVMEIAINNYALHRRHAI